MNNLVGYVSLDCEKAKQEAEAQNTDPCITFKCSGGMLQQRMQMCPSDESLYAKCPEPSQTPQECCKSCSKCETTEIRI